MSRIFISGFLFTLTLATYKSVGQEVKEPSLKYRSLYEHPNRQTAKEKIKAGDYLLVSLYNQLIDQADMLLAQGPYSIVWNEALALSNDPHDYYSLAPYWWPDETKKSGLPWIRKDGQVNPQTKLYDSDDQVKDRMFKSIEILTWAYYYSDEEKYAQKIIHTIDTFFLEEDTKMNPHLDFAQAIPGKNSGRWIGIIEFTRVADLVSTLQLLEDRNVMPEDIKQGIRHWMESYVEWLLNSDFGKAECAWPNNHGTWYDVQVVSILIYLSRISEAKAHINQITKSRIESQIAPDGSQPQELERTKTLSYSKMNLWAFTMLAIMADNLGINLLEYTSSKGSGIIQAYEYLLPYASETKDWTHQQISPLDKVLSSLQSQFRKMCSLYTIPSLCQLDWSSFEAKEDLNMLIYPQP